MEKDAFRIADACVYWQSGPNASTRLLEQVLAAFDTACDMEEAGLAAGLAERLLALMDDIPGAGDFGQGEGSPVLERVVDARFRLLEVKYHLNCGGRRNG
jgi:hypothetical protein